MTMDTVKLCLCAIAGVGLAVILRQWKGDWVILLRLAMTLALGATALSAAAPLIRYLQAIPSLSGLSDYAEPLLKALGIGMLTQVCADICRECGETGVANGVELFGKVEILLLCLPLIHQLLEVAEELLSMGGAL